MRSNAWARAFSWCNIEFWFSDNSGNFCRQHPSNAPKLPGTTVYNPNHMEQIHVGQCLSNQKRQPTTTWNLRDSSVHFLVEETLSPYTVITATWFQHHTQKKNNITFYDVLKKVFITTCNGWLGLTDFNTVHFLIVSQKIQYKFCTDTTLLKFLSKFDGKIDVDAHFVSNFSDSYTTTSTNYSKNTLDMIFCWCGSHRGLGSSPTDILPSLKRLNQSQYSVWPIQSFMYAWVSKGNVSV